MDEYVLIVVVPVGSESLLFLEGRCDVEARRRRRSLTTMAFHLAV
jgi:hypothetical protein